MRQCAREQAAVGRRGIAEPAPVSRGTISSRRIASSSRTSASRAVASGVWRAVQSSTADRSVAGRADRGPRRRISRRPRHIRCVRPLRTASARPPWKSQKNGKGTVEPHSSPMNSIGTIGASKVTASAASIASASARPSSRSPSGAIADLVVVLQEIDEGRRRQLAARLAARFLPPMRRGLALVDEAGRERARNIHARRLRSRGNSPRSPVSITCQAW